MRSERVDKSLELSVVLVSLTGDVVESDVAASVAEAFEEIPLNGAKAKTEEQKISNTLNNTNNFFIHFLLSDKCLDILYGLSIFLAIAGVEGFLRRHADSIDTTER